MPEVVPKQSQLTKIMEVLPAPVKKYLWRNKRLLTILGILALGVLFFGSLIYFGLAQPYRLNRTPQVPISNPPQTPKPSLAAKTCADFTYSDWAPCDSTGLQSRSVTERAPFGCTGGEPLVSQACTARAPVPTPLTTQVPVPPLPTNQGTSPITVKVMTVTYYSGQNPANTFDYNGLIGKIVSNLNQASTYRKNGFQNANFQVTKQLALTQTAPQNGTNCDQYLPKVQQGQWTTADWQSTNCWGSGTASYPLMLSQNNVCDFVNNNQIDEVWFLAFGNGGFWEANMTGPGAFWTNGPVVPGTNCNKAIHVMGLNYELPPEYALHSFGHRIEGTMNHYLFPEFSQFNSHAPNGNSSCGNVHFPPNASQDYEYGNTTTLSNSDCQDWNVSHTGQRQQVNCNTWGCSQLGYMMWWMEGIPGANNTLSKLDGTIMPNWWKLIVSNKF